MSAILPQAAGYGVVVSLSPAPSYRTDGADWHGSFLFLGHGRLFLDPDTIHVFQDNLGRRIQHCESKASEIPLVLAPGTRLLFSIPPGLVAAGIVSAWTWAATLLQSSATA